MSFCMYLTNLESGKTISANILKLHGLQVSLETCVFKGLSFFDYSIKYNLDWLVNTHMKPKSCFKRPNKGICEIF